MRGTGGRARLMVGVDVSDASIKLVRVRGTGARASAAGSTVQGAARALPAAAPGTQALVAGGPYGETAAAELKRLVDEMGWRGESAAIALGGNDVVVRRFTMPDMKPADLLSALRLECRKHVPGPVEESEVGYEVLGRSDREGSWTVDLLVTVAPRRKVEQARGLLLGAGLRPACVTIRPVALVALLEALGETTDDVVAYLDVGAAESHVTVIKGGEVRFARALGVGGASFTEALRSIVVPGQGTVGLTLEEAEALKRAQGIPYGPEETGMAGSIPLTAVAVMLRPVLERLVRELWNSFDYVHEQFLGESVARVVLLGEGSRLQNLPEYLTGVLKMPVSRADLVERAGTRPAPRDGAGPAPVSELGLGLGFLGKDAINFLERPDDGTAHRLARAVPQRAAAAAAAALLLSVSLPAEMTVMRERGRVEGLRASLGDARPRTEALRRFREARAEETRLNDLLARLAGGQVLWSYVLRDLSWRVGDDARLTTLEVVEPGPAAGAAAPAGESGREVRLSGLLRTDHERPEKVLGELMESLSRSPAFEHVRLEGCQALTPELSTFTVTARLAE